MQRALHVGFMLGCLMATACGSDDDAPYIVAPSGPTACDAYCGFMAINCTRGFLQYANNTDCLAACADFVVNTDADDSTGNTLQCRMIYAVTANRPERRRAFCDNAGPSGGDDCQP